ncbi:hypothetical protein ACVI1N_003118 [Sinorhizobium medicae]
MRRLSISVSDSTLRSGSNLRDPFAARIGNEARCAVCRNAHHLAVFAAGQQRVVRLVYDE